MLDPKLSIPRVMVSGLVFGGVVAGCGGNGGGDDAGFDAGMDAGFDAGMDAGSDAGVEAGSDAGVLTQAELARQFCEAYEECDPEYFSYSYSSQAECNAVLNGYWDELTGEYGAACGEAVLAYYACFVPEYSMTCGEPDCVDEGTALEAACQAP